MNQVKPVKRLLFTFGLIVSSLISSAQNDSIPKKGSYLSFGQPIIEDNSILIEEAFNQEAGVIQYISTLSIDKAGFIYSFTQEIPLADIKHQLSLAITYNSFKLPDSTKRAGRHQLSNGVGDFFISYRPLLMGKKDWAMIIPRFTLIVPTGDARYGFGSGGWGTQFNLAVTKRFRKNIVTNFNGGYTIILKGDNYHQDTEGLPKLMNERNLMATNLGASVIWLARPKFNLIMEYVSMVQQGFQGEKKVDNPVNSIINPCARFSINVAKTQIVLSAGLPLYFIQSEFQRAGTFIYLSIEPGS